jgi:hypothetical protein
MKILLAVMSGVCIVLGLSLMLVAQDVDSPPALRARIAVLEGQLQKLQLEGDVCLSQLKIVLAPQQREQQQTAEKERLDAVAKDMGCGADASKVNWNAKPYPTCLPDPKKDATK